MSLQAYEIEELIARYIGEEQLTDREQEVLNEWLRKEENKQLFDELVDKNTWDPHLKDINFYRSRQSDAKKKLDSLLLMATPFVPVKKLLIKYVAAASVVAVVATGGIYLLTRPKQEVVKAKPVPAVVQDVPPGGEKATLILGDGSTVVLDDARNGVIRTEGNAKIVKGDGEVKYEGGGKGGEVMYNKLVTPRGGQYRISLPDGSKAWLNAASSIKYPVVFKGDERKVEVTGEVYFEVVRNAKKPFRVNVMQNAAKAEVEVLGTHFNVNCYNDEPEIATTLVEGVVKVTNNKKIGNQSIKLKPGQQAQLNATGALDVKEVNVEHFLAWKNGYFSFKHDKLSKVLREVSRWYDIDVIYAPNVSDVEISGKIERSTNLTGVLRILSLLQITYEVKGKTLIINGTNKN